MADILEQIMGPVSKNVEDSILADTDLDEPFKKVGDNLGRKRFARAMVDPCNAVLDFYIQRLEARRQKCSDRVASAYGEYIAESLGHFEDFRNAVHEWLDAADRLSHKEAIGDRISKANGSAIGIEIGLEQLRRKHDKFYRTSAVAVQRALIAAGKRIRGFDQLESQYRQLDTDIDAYLHAVADAPHPSIGSGVGQEAIGTLLDEAAQQQIAAIWSSAYDMVDEYLQTRPAIVKEEDKDLLRTHLREWVAAISRDVTERIVEKAPIVADAVEADRKSCNNRLKELGRAVAQFRNDMIRSRGILGAALEATKQRSDAYAVSTSYDVLVNLAPPEYVSGTSVRQTMGSSPGELGLTDPQYARLLSNQRQARDIYLEKDHAWHEAHASVRSHLDLLRLDEKKIRWATSEDFASSEEEEEEEEEEPVKRERMRRVLVWPERSGQGQGRRRRGPLDPSPEYVAAYNAGKEAERQRRRQKVETRLGRKRFIYQGMDEDEEED